MKWLWKAVVLVMLLAWGPGAPVMAEEEPGAKPAALNFEYQGLWPSDRIQAEQEAAGKFADNSSLDAPTRAAALNERALCWYFLGEHERARAALDEAIKLDSKKAAYYVNRAIMLRRLGENDKAKADYQSALEIEPKNVFALNNRGWLLLLEAQATASKVDRKNRIEQAKKDLQDAVRIQQEEKKVRLPLAQVNLAAALILEADAKSAEAALKEADADLKSMMPWTRQCALLNLGEIARSNGDWQAAERRYQEAYDLGRNDQLPPPPKTLHAGRSEAKENPWILQRLGAAKFVLGQYADAEEHLRRAREKLGADQVAGRYAYLLSALADAHARGREAISTELPNKAPERWVDALELYLAGRLDEGKLPQYAQDKDVTAQRAKQCEMYFYMAQRNLLNKRPDEAKKLLRQCVETKEACRLEHTMAAFLLKEAPGGG